MSNANYTNVGCGGGSWTRQAPGGTTTPVSSPPIVVATPARDTTSDKVGATVAQFRVDEGGNATYSLSIQAPPGTAGMMPKLALSYNSRMPNGVMGPGWSIEGSSQIGRCRQTRESGDFVGGTSPDGNPAPVNFTPSDRFCLDGVRLLLLTASTTGYGANGSIYSPENDPTTVVTASVSNVNAGPDLFTVQRKDGTTSMYGNTTASPNARITATLNSQSVAISWNLARAQDSAGNYIDYLYTNQPAVAGGTLPFAAGAVEFVLAKVNYTGHATAPASLPYASVTFNYNTLPIANVHLGYQAGIAFLQSQQLESVTVTDSSVSINPTVRYYYLQDGYQASASGSGSQVLTKITECRDSTRAVCFPPTTFNWSAANYQFDSTTNTQSAPGGAIFYQLVGYKVGDIDGDGRQDFVWAVNDGKCSPGSSIYVGFLDRDANNQMTLVTAGTSGQSQSPTCAPIDLTNNDRAWYLVDYNGDGRADLMIGGGPGSNWAIYPSQGRPTSSGATAFNQSTGANLLASLPTPITVPTGNSNLTAAVGILADLNGDGLPDFIYPVSPSTPGSGIADVMVRLMVRQSSGGFAFSDPYRLDLNLDPDPTKEPACYTSTSPTCYPTFNVFYFDAGHHSAMATDVNGDGRADLTFIIDFVPDGCTTCQPVSASAFNPTLGQTSPTGSTTTTTAPGSGHYWYQFTADAITQAVGTTPARISLNEYWHQRMVSAGGTLPDDTTKFYAVDLNGDGLADILYQDATTATTYWAMINTGSGYQAAIPVYNISNGSLLQFADVNGDGKIDLIYPTGDITSTTTSLVYYYVDVVPSTATAWAFTPAQAIGTGVHNTGQWVSLFGDFDGDGITDFLSVLTGSNSSTGNLYTTRVASTSACIASSNSATCSRYHAHDVITAFTNGFGATTTVAYQPLTNNGVYQAGSAGASAVTNANWGYGSPVFAVLAPMYVVSAASSSAPVQTSSSHQSTVYYQYEWARMQAGGRGFLGFKKILTYDANDVGTTNQYVETLTNYNQSFPFTGTPLSTNKLVHSGAFTRGSATVDSCAVNGPESTSGCFGPTSWPGVAATLVSFSESQVRCLGAGCTAPSATTCSNPSPVLVYTEPGTFSPPSSPQPLFVYTQATSDALLDLGNGTQTSETSNYFCYDGNATTPSRGNLLNSTTVTQDGNGNTVEQKFLTNTYYDNTSLWRLGRLTSSIAQFVRPGTPSITRTTSYCYDFSPNTFGCTNLTTTGFSTGLLLSERIQPGGSADQDIRTVYTVDPYGNRKAAYQCSADLTDAACTSTSGFVQQQSGTQVHRYAKTTYDSVGRYTTGSALPFYSSGGSGNLNEQPAISIAGRDEFGNATSQSGINGLTQNAEFGTMGRAYFAADNTGKASTTTFRSCTAVSCPSDTTFRSQTLSVGAPSSWTYYDVIGRPILTAAQTFDANPSTQQYSGVCSYYDAHNRPVYQSQPFFVPATVSGDGSPTLSTTTPCNSASFSTTSTYDVLGRVTQATNPDLGTIKKSYSSLITSTTNPRNYTWTETRDALGQVTATQDPTGTGDPAVGLLVNQTYDAAGDVLTISRNANNGPITTLMTYDALGRKQSINDPDAGSVTYHYNAGGDVILQTDAKGQTITQSNDALGRRWQRVSSGVGNTLTDTWTFDTSAYGFGQLASEARTSTTGVTFSRAMVYDTYGRPYQRVTSIAASNYTETTAYDGHGRLLAQQDASSYSLTPGYSPNGFVATQTDSRIGAVYQLLGTTARGQASFDERGGSAALLSTLNYDPATGRISTICSGTSCALQDLSYHFDLVGNLDRRARAASTQPTIEVFTNDALNRLTSAKLTVVQGVNQGTPIATASLGYDLLGNICTKNGAAYRYGPLGGCVNPTTTGSPQAVAQVGAIPYGYDADGNQINGNGRTLSYNALNQLTSASAGTTSTAFQYTPDGDRFQRVDSTGTTTWYVGNVEILRVSGATTETRRYLAGAAIDYVRASGNNETRYTFNDHLGSVDTIASATGTLIEAISFDAHGNLRNPATWNGAAGAPTSTTHGFTGHEEMYSLNLTHMNGRIYDPTLGRMLQADPMGDVGNQGLNRYSYVLNNPLALTDPTGYFSWHHLFSHPMHTLDPLAAGVMDNQYGRLAVAIAASYFTYGLASSWAVAYVGEGIAAGAIAGASAGFVSGAIQSNGNLQGALDGAFSGAVFGGLGGYFGNSYSITRIAVEATAGGVVSTIEGGKFGNGFVSAGVGAAAMPLVGRLQYASERVVAAAIIGGTASEISGGKFANGAMTAAFQEAFSSIASGAAQNRATNQRMAALAYGDPAYYTADVIALNDPNVVNLAILGPQGHLAEIIGDDTNGWTYVSKNGGPYNVSQNFDTLADFESDPASARYANQYRISTTSEQDAAMISFANSEYSSEYGALTNNCADLVIGTFRAGSLNVPYKWVAIPNYDYNLIKQNNSGFILSGH